MKNILTFSNVTLFHTRGSCLKKCSLLVLDPRMTDHPQILGNADSIFLKAFFEKANNDPTIELELKFKNVSVNSFNHILKKMQGEFPENQQRVVYIFDRIVKNPNPNSRGDIRMSEIHRNGKIEKNTYSKEEIHPSKKLSEFNIKVSLNKETVVNGDFSACPTSLFREKRRFQFTTEMFVFDLSVVKSGDSYEDVCQGRFNQTFEIELEFIGNKSPKFMFREGFFLHELTNMIMYLETQLQGCSKFCQLTRYSETCRVQQFFTEVLGGKTGRFVEPRPITLHHRHLSDIVENKYVVSSKPDGYRKYLIFTTEKNSKGEAVSYMYDSGSKRVQKTNIVAKTDVENTVFDGEWMPVLQKFLAFDILVFKAMDTRNSSLDSRRLVLERIVGSLDPNLISIKPIFEKDVMQAAGEIIRQFKDPKRPYENDGLIFTPPGPYNGDSPIFKWKPGNCNTIDFCLLQVEGTTNQWNLYNMTKNADRELVFNGQSIAKFPHNSLMVWNQQHPLSDGNCIFSGCVAECHWDKENKTFVPQRLRVDKINAKKYGNAMSVALDNWESIENPVTIDHIENFSEQVTVTPPSPKPIQEQPAVVPVDRVSEAVKADTLKVPTVEQVKKALPKKRKTPSKETKVETTVEAKEEPKPKRQKKSTETKEKKKKITIKELKEIAKDKGISKDEYEGLNKQQLHDLVLGENK